MLPIQVSPETLKRLESHRNTVSERPNTTIRRLLDELDQLRSKRRRPTLIANPARRTSEETRKNFVRDMLLDGPRSREEIVEALEPVFGATTIPNVSSLISDVRRMEGIKVEKTTLIDGVVIYHATRE